MHTLTVDKTTIENCGTSPTDSTSSQESVIVSSPTPGTNEDTVYTTMTDRTELITVDPETTDDITDFTFGEAVEELVVIEEA